MTSPAVLDLIDRLEVRGTPLCKEAAAALRVAEARIAAQTDLLDLVSEIIKPTPPPREPLRIIAERKD